MGVFLARREGFCAWIDEKSRFRLHFLRELRVEFCESVVGIWLHGCGVGCLGCVGLLVVDKENQNENQVIGRLKMSEFGVPSSSPYCTSDSHVIRMLSLAASNMRRGVRVPIHFGAPVASVSTKHSSGVFRNKVRVIYVLLLLLLEMVVFLY